MDTVSAPLSPRKSPVQARSAATLDALHTAVIQVLVAEGLGACTTTRLARRAGMSVGSLYQYYPNRDALLAAVLERHLDGGATAVERACEALTGRPLADMAAGLITAYLTVKLRDPQVSRALYAVAAERGGARLIARMHERQVAAVAAMLDTAADGRIEDARSVATVAMSALTGPARAVLQGQAPPQLEAGLHEQLVRLIGAYLATYKAPLCFVE